MSDKGQGTSPLIIVLIVGALVMLVGAGFAFMLFFSAAAYESEERVLQATIQQAPEEVFEDAPEVELEEESSEPIVEDEE